MDRTDANLLAAARSGDSTVIPRCEIEARLADLKEGSGRDIVTFGSRTLWNHLLAAGLVDELHLVVGPTVLGGGTSIFGAPAAGLTLLDTRRFEGSDNVVLRYACSSVGHLPAVAFRHSSDEQNQVHVTPHQ